MELEVFGGLRLSVLYFGAVVLLLVCSVFGRY